MCCVSYILCWHQTKNYPATADLHSHEQSRPLLSPWSTIRRWQHHSPHSSSCRRCSPAWSRGPPLPLCQSPPLHRPHDNGTQLTKKKRDRQSLPGLTWCGKKKWKRLQIISSTHQTGWRKEKGTAGKMLPCHRMLESLFYLRRGLKAFELERQHSKYGAPKDDTHKLSTSKFVITEWIFVFFYTLRRLELICKC